jgi:hypothetical protein
MSPSEAWEDSVSEEFCIYLEELDPDIFPMDFRSFLAVKLREWAWNEGERYELETIY